MSNRKYVRLSFIISIALWLLVPQIAYADNCGSLNDCYNTLRAALAAAVGVGIFAAILSIGLDFVPVVGTIKGVIEALTGRDLVTGAELAWWERVLGVVPLGGAVLGIIPTITRTARIVDAGTDSARAVDRAGDIARAADRAGDISRTADEAGDVARHADEAADLGTLVNKYGDDARNIVDEYGEALGSDILRTYDDIAGLDGADRLMRDLLSASPSTRQGALSELGYASSLQKQGLQIEKVADVIDGKKAGDILIRDGPVIDVKDYNWGSSYYRNPTNVDKAVESLVNQARLHQQRYPGRPVEFAFTDLPNVPQKIVDALRNMGVDVTQVTWPAGG